MTADEIKKLVLKGKTICYKSNAYKIIKNEKNEFFIYCQRTNYSIGLCKKNGELNGEEADFFLEK